jgi:predicted RNA binding protein YcfA (HicA-like mRNA interferase family)
VATVLWMGASWQRHETFRAYGSHDHRHRNQRAFCGQGATGSLAFGDLLGDQPREFAIGFLLVRAMANTSHEEVGTIANEKTVGCAPLHKLQVVSFHFLSSRDLSRAELIKRLGRHYGYRRVNQEGSHVILETSAPRQHRIAIPDHSPLAHRKAECVLRGGNRAGREEGRNSAAIVTLPHTRVGSLK